LKALNTDVTLYKLGKTANLKNRLNTYNSGNANDVEPFFIIPVNDIDAVESCIKNLCKKYQYRKYKEVYEIDIDVLKEIMSDCNEFVNKMTFKLTNNIEKQKFKKHISRMKKKLDKYFIYVDREKEKETNTNTGTNTNTKTNTNAELTQNLLEESENESENESDYFLDV
jgi:hypothetical protein